MFSYLPVIELDQDLILASCSILLMSIKSWTEIIHIFLFGVHLFGLYFVLTSVLASSPKSPVLYSALWCWDLDPVNHTFPLLAGFLLDSASGALERTLPLFLPVSFSITQQHFCLLVVRALLVLSSTSTTSFIPFPQKYQSQLSDAPSSKVWVPSLRGPPPSSRSTSSS